MSNIKELSKEYSYEALKRGNGSVRLLSKGIANDDGLDILSIEGDTKELIGVKAITEKEELVISDVELRTMDECSGREKTDYIIHRYVFNNNKVTSFNMYRYDRENKVLIDLIDSSNVLSINKESKTKKYVCVPQKKID